MGLEKLAEKIYRHTMDFHPYTGINVHAQFHSFILDGVSAHLGYVAGCTHFVSYT